MKRWALGIVLLVVVVAAPAAADVPDGWADLVATGVAAHACPGAGTEAVVDVVLEHGAIVVLGEDGAPVSEHALPGVSVDLAARYVVGETTATMLTGRPTETITVLDGELIRLEVVVDPVTTMPLMLTSYQADGDPHCSIVLLDWEVGDPQDGHGDAAVLAERPDLLPGSIHEFALSDVVVGEGFVAGFYRDGLFTFSLTVWSDQLVVEGTDESGRAELGPGRALQSWPVGETTYVMIGDLPPDVRDSVVRELPEPDRTGFLGRLWNRLFG